MKKLFAVILSAALICALAMFLPINRNANAETMVDSGIDYNESLDLLHNPDRGSFKLEQYAVRDSAAVDGNGTKEHFKKYFNKKYYPEGNTLFLLSFGLEYYSANMGGTDEDITENGLKYIDRTIANCIDAGGNVLIRFSYDAHGKSYDKKKDCEPKSISQVIKHVKQLAPIINKYSANITALQSSMFGPWGEQHTTTMGEAENVSNYYSLINTWLDNTSDDVWVQVRRPLYFLHWYNTKYKTNYTTKNIDAINYKNDKKANRICCYNDGYLASSSDWGTYTSRENEINWLSSLTYAPFGGEVCSEKQGSLDTYNSISFLEKEAFDTHTSFLNYEYDYENVISLWENESYNGADKVYKNKTSSFVYVFNHLGYRLVLRKSELSEKVEKGGSLNIVGKIENVGFGNISRKQDAALVITDSKNKVVLEKTVDIDAQSFLSQSSVNYSVNASIDSLTEGTYKAYLKLSGLGQVGSGLRYIRFANNNIFSEELSANFIGDFSVVKKSTTSSSSKSSSTSQKADSSSQEVKSTSKENSSAVKSKDSDVTKSSAIKSKDSEIAKSSAIKSKDSDITKSSATSSDKLENSKKTKKSGCSSSITSSNTLMFGLCLILIILPLFKRRKND